MKTDGKKSSLSVCKALDSGIAAIFGPQSGGTSAHVQSICDTLEIPHVETRYVRVEVAVLNRKSIALFRWDYRTVREDYSLNLYPHPQAIGQVRDIQIFKVESKAKFQLKMIIR